MRGESGYTLIADGLPKLKLDALEFALGNRMLGAVTTKANSEVLALADQVAAARGFARFDQLPDLSVLKGIGPRQLYRLREVALLDILLASDEPAVYSLTRYRLSDPRTVLLELARCAGSMDEGKFLALAGSLRSGTIRDPALGESLVCLLDRLAELDASARSTKFVGRARQASLVSAAVGLTARLGTQGDAGLTAALERLYATPVDARASSDLVDAMEKLGIELPPEDRL